MTRVAAAGESDGGAKRFFSIFALAVTLCLQVFVLLRVAPGYMALWKQMEAYPGESARIPWLTRLLFDGAMIIPWSLAAANLVLILGIARRLWTRLSVVLVALAIFWVSLVAEFLALYLPVLVLPK